MSHSHHYEHKLYPKIPEGLYIVEVGAGWGDMGYFIKTRKRPLLLIGIEPFPAYALVLRRFGIYDDVINSTAEEVGRDVFKADLVLCADVIEHGDQDKADDFVKLLESWAPNVIITTPNGNMANPYATDGNELNKHRSFYRPAFFQERGYDVEIVEFRPHRRLFRWAFKLYHWLAGLRNIEEQIIATKGPIFERAKRRPGTP